MHSCQMDQPKCNDTPMSFKQCIPEENMRPKTLNQLLPHGTVENYFKCDICNDRFQTANKLKKHYYICTNIKENSQCSHQYKNPTNLLHILGHLDTNYNGTHSENLLCKKCTGNKSIDAILTKHLVYNISEKEVYCEVCFFAFKSENHLEKHKQEQVGIQSCDICKQKYCHEKQLQDHIKEYHTPVNEDITLCKICPRELYFPSLLALHISTEHSESNMLPNEIYKRPIDNTIANIEINSLSLVDPNLVINYGGYDSENSEDSQTEPTVQSIDIYNCNVCLQEFDHEDDFVKHQTNLTEKHIFSCKTCCIKFCSPQDYEQHMGSHSDHDVNTTSEPTAAATQKVIMDSNSSKFQLFSTLQDGVDNVDKYACKYCNLVFQYKSLLNLHIRKIHSKLFKCKTCRIKFPRKSLLHCHQCKPKSVKRQCEQSIKNKKQQKDKNKIKPVQVQDNCMQLHQSKLKNCSDRKMSACTICSERFQYPYQLKRHNLTHSNVRSYQCNICANKFKTKGHLNRHKRNVHKFEEEKSFSCTRCEKMFQFPYQLNQHIANHCSDIPDDGSASKVTTADGQIKDFLCSYCNKSFEYLYLLNTHVLTHIGEKPYQCKVCLKRFRQNNNLLRHHREVHLTEKDRKYQCTKCHERFERDDVLSKHMRSHVANNYFLCEICSIYFSNEIALQKHREERNEIKTCLSCDRKFCYEKHFILHKCSVGNRVPKKIFCGICMLGYASLFSLKGHQSRLHSESLTVKEKCFKCEFCNEGFAIRVKLDAHRVIHTGVKPYQCNICSRGFLYEGDLRTHNRKFVTMFSCGDCSIKFCIRQKYDKHMRSCMKKSILMNDTFSCDSCNKNFQKYEEFLRHFCFNNVKNKISNDDVMETQHITSTLSNNVKKDIACLEDVSQNDSVDLQPAGMKVVDEDDNFVPTKKLCSSTQSNSSSKLFCDICMRIFTDIKMHKSRVHPESLTEKEKCFKCEFCNEAFGVKEKLDAHRVVHTGVKPYQCNICSRGFIYDRDLTMHKKRFPNMFSCDDCGIKFCIKKKYENHLILCNKESTDTFSCNSCNKYFQSYEETQRHFCFNKVENKTISKDGSLNASLETQSAGKKVIDEYDSFVPTKKLCSSTQSNSSSKLFCGICMRIFTDIKIHKSRVHPESLTEKEKCFKCEFCNEAFGVKEKLDAHRIVHTGVKPYQCNICSRGFIYDRDLTMHKKRFPTMFSCDDCGIKFCIKKKYENHLILCNKESTDTFSCNSCNKNFQSYEETQRHFCFNKVKNKTISKDVSGNDSVELHPAGIKVVDEDDNFVPTKKLCSSTQSNSSSKLFCDICTGRCTDLKLHQSQIYPESLTEKEKCFKCEFCNEGFAIRVKLDAHRVVHTGVKPYQCNICSRGFLYEGDLRTHNRKFVTTFSCDDCGIKFCIKQKYDKHMRSCMKK